MPRCGCSSERVRKTTCKSANNISCSGAGCTNGCPPHAPRLNQRASATTWGEHMIRWKLFLATVILLASSSVCARAQSGITAQSGRQVTCASDDGRRHLCSVNTRFGVRMVNQRSGSPCIQGQTWGFNGNGIWVDRGCRADFWLGGGYRAGGSGGGRGQMVTCSSNSGRSVCNVDTTGGVRMVRQRSGSPCIQGQTWGFTRTGIWVDRGCRADFQVGGR